MTDDAGNIELRLFTSKKKRRQTSSKQSETPPEVKASRLDSPEDRRAHSAKDEATPSGAPSSFADLALSPHLVKTCESLGMRQPTPVQVRITMMIIAGL